ncbi:ATP-binding protein [Anaerocolumna sp. AGMB13025]|uniref:sensor histidine kinase n=1 Tax=Anaerocolumna sp. AGMB13025 TaxID=3039116 RepID=UPI00241F817B|nr:sensor histidine kinase [Anaerocolumna sp. AGMB13025]WFR56136.1 ATP-binding protein [Anaerocolumna sp. AGMB13025]
MKPGLKLKSSLFLAVLLLMTVMALSFLILSGVKNNQIRQNETYLTEQGVIAGNYIKQMYLMESVKDPEVFVKERGTELVKRFEMLTQMQVVLYDMNGEEVADSIPLAAKTDIKELLHYALKDINTYTLEGDTMIFLAPLHNSGKQIGVVQFNYSIQKDRLFYEKLEQLFWYAGIFIFISCFLCGYFYINPITKGILNLKHTAQRIEEGDYSDIKPLKRRDELGDLSRNIYYMGNRIKNQLEEMKAEQDNLKMAVEKLEILGVQQKQFIGNVTHEFKTPLTVIKAYADLMNLYQDDPKLLEEAKGNIDTEISKLTTMIDQVLTLSALENYNFEFHPEQIALDLVMKEICDRLMSKAKQHNITLHMELDQITILADKERMSQVFINLIDNAIKYNKEEGHIWVSLNENMGEACIQIKDTGIGIPEEARDKIFTPFYTVNKAYPGSTGLGLALVWELVKKQGGRIELLENPEEGTLFEIRYPL